MAGAPVEVQPSELQLAFEMRQQAAFDAVPFVPVCDIHHHVENGITSCDHQQDVGHIQHESRRT